METIFKTDVGKIRSHNEDSVDVFKKSGQLLLVIADGMGGHNAGEVASGMAISELKERWDQLDTIDSPSQAEEWLRHQIEEINTAIFTHAQENTECEGMGTTIVTVFTNGSFATIAHLGDARCYLMNEDGFKQITEDHSLVNELVKSGQISKEDAEHHPRKNWLTRGLGTELSIEVDLRSITLDEGDYLLLCSDGLSNKITSSEMESFLSSEQTLEEKADLFINTANDNGGEDNITLAILLNTSESEEGE